MTTQQATLLATGHAGENTAPHFELLERVKAALTSASEVSVSTDNIRPFRGQPRKHFNSESIQLLSASIDTGGQITPGIILQRPGSKEYELIDGERRWRAIKLIPTPRRPLFKAKLVEADDDVLQFIISGVANFNREEHTALEVMGAIDRYLSFGFPMKVIADLLGHLHGHLFLRFHG